MKNSKKILMGAIIGIAVGGLAGLLFAEGTITETQAKGSPAKYTFAWTASTNGHVGGVSTFHVRGQVLRAVLTGISTGTTYSVTLKDESAVDILAGLGAGIASNAVVSVVPAEQMTDNASSTNLVAPFAINDILTLSVTNVGSLKTGSVILYVE